MSNPLDLDLTGLSVEDVGLGLRPLNCLRDLDVDPGDPEFRETLAKIPPREADMIEMLLWGCVQRQIGDYFGLSQSGVSYRLQRAAKRIRFMRALPKVTPEDVERDLADVFDRRGRRTFSMIIDGHNLVSIAQAIGVTPNRVRQLVARLYLVLDPIVHKKYRKFLRLMNGNWNTRRYVKPGKTKTPELPQD